MEVSKYHLLIQDVCKGSCIAFDWKIRSWFDFSKFYEYEACPESKDTSRVGR